MTDDMSFDSGMEVPEEETVETSFRRGALQAARWLAWVAQRMAQENQDTQQIAVRLDALTQVLTDWRHDHRQKRLPLYPPWEWNAQELNVAIERHRE